MTVKKGAAPVCPECMAGKHQNCNGEAWDFDQDKVTICRCFKAAHRTPTGLPSSRLQR